jgi:hypothetical protein
MTIPTGGKALDEPALLKAYMDLTGCCEPKARAVFMYVCPDGKPGPAENGNGATAPEPEPRSNSTFSKAADPT